MLDISIDNSSYSQIVASLNNDSKCFQSINIVRDRLEQSGDLDTLIGMVNGMLNKEIADTIRGKINRIKENKNQISSQ